MGLHRLTCRCEAALHVLLVGKDQDGAVEHERILDDGLELSRSFGHPLTVLRVDDKDEAVSVVEVVPPQWPQLLLASNIPYCKDDVLVLHLRPPKAKEAHVTLTR